MKTLQWLSLKIVTIVVVVFSSFSVFCQTICPENDPVSQFGDQPPGCVLCNENIKGSNQGF